MHRRQILTLPLIALLPAWSPATGWRDRVAEIRAGTTQSQARQIAHRLRIRVLAVRTRLVDRLDAGHLELALLTDAELALARHRMGDRLVLLPGPVDGRTRATRRVLPEGLRAELAAVAL